MEIPAKLELPIASEVHAGIDWLTVTAKSPEARRALFRLFSDAKDELRARNEEGRAWRFMGYVGYNLGSVRWGTRDDSDIAMLSGAAAGKHWRLFATYAEHCSRIDLAVTATLPFAWPDLAGQYYYWHKQGNAQPEVRNVSYTLIEGTRSGQTCYVGARSSSQMGRIYDKGAEEEIGIPRGILWRYEIEYKKPLAQAALIRLLDYAEDDPIHETIRDHVADWFKRRDCPPIFVCGTKCLELEVEAKVSSAETQLWWLSTQVSPTVKKLVESGRHLDVLKALGLFERLTAGEELEVPK